MNPFIESLHSNIVEDIRLLEVFVTSPLGLHSDIKMLRESLEVEGTDDLQQPESQARRTSFRSITKDAPSLALGTIRHLGQALQSLRAFDTEAIAPITPEWITRTHMVLDRAEEKIGNDLRSALTSMITGLYVIIGPDTTNERPVLEIAKAVLEGGAKILQLRDKSTNKGQLLITAKEMKVLCEEYDALFIFNDDADIAVLSDAHGLHVGQDDLPLIDARSVLQTSQLVGRSSNNVDEALQAQADDADYIAIGAVFPTNTMGKTARKAVGIDAVRQVKESVSPPVVAIGGITVANAPDVVQAGADAIALASAVTMAADPETATKQLLDTIEAARR